MHLHDLLYCSDEQFLHNCYTFILRREPDPEGFTYYMQALKEGRSRVRIVQGLARSAEGRSSGVRVHGLRSALFWWHICQMPVFGPALRRLAKAEDPSDIQARIRGLEALSARLVLLAEQDVAAPHVRARRPNFGEYEVSSSLSPRAREIFEELLG